MMSLRLFNLSMDRVAGEWKARIMNSAVYLDERDGRQYRMSSLLFMDDVVMIVDSEEWQRMVNEVNGAGV